MTTLHLSPMPERAPLYDKLYYVIMPCMVGLFLLGGSFLRTIPSSEDSNTNKSVKIATQFIIKEEIKSVVVPKPVKKKSIANPKKPEDLTSKPQLKQKANDTQPVKPTSKKKVRRVYGLRKVYSQGLGTGGSLSNAVVSKLGNTLNKEIDTIKATTSDIKGQIASTTTITSPPRFKNRIKPAYTKKMKEHQVAGKVKARVLVDVDGKAKKIIITNDLGFGTKEASIDAINKMTFEPARINNDPVAVWIPLTFRFEFSV